MSGYTEHDLDYLSNLDRDDDQYIEDEDPWWERFADEVESQREWDETWYVKEEVER